MSSTAAVSSVRETEVVEKAKRRGFSAQYKLRVLAETERAAASGRSVTHQRHRDDRIRPVIAVG